MAILEASQVVLDATGGGLWASRGRPGVQQPKEGGGFQPPYEDFERRFGGMSEK